MKDAPWDWKSERVYESLWWEDEVLNEWRGMEGMVR